MAGLTLAEFLARPTPKNLPCALWVADWVLARRGVDLAQGLRERATRPISAARLIMSAGGLTALAAQQAERAGLFRTDAPQRGDIGLVEAFTGAGEGVVAAICTGPRWAALTAKGLISAPGAFTDAWRV